MFWVLRSAAARGAIVERRMKRGWRRCRSLALTHSRPAGSGIVVPDQLPGKLRELIGIGKEKRVGTHVVEGDGKVDLVVPRPKLDGSEPGGTNQKNTLVSWIDGHLEIGGERVALTYVPGRTLQRPSRSPAPMSKAPAHKWRRYACRKRMRIRRGAGRVSAFSASPSLGVVPGAVAPGPLHRGGVGSAAPPEGWPPPHQRRLHPRSRLPARRVGPLLDPQARAASRAGETRAPDLQPRHRSLPSIVIAEADGDLFGRARASLAAVVVPGKGAASPIEDGETLVRGMAARCRSVQCERRRCFVSGWPRSVVVRAPFGTQGAAPCGSRAWEMPPVGLVAGALAACLVLGCIGEIDGAGRGLSATGGAPGNPSGGDGRAGEWRARRNTAAGRSQGRAVHPPRPSTNPIGRVTIRRLNRAEYNNTVRDLRPQELRPADPFEAVPSASASTTTATSRR